VQIAYEGLGLSMDGHEIGTMRYIDLPEEVLHDICAWHLDFVNEKLYHERPPASDQAADFLWCRDIRANSFLHYTRWLWVLKNIKTYEPLGWNNTQLTSEIRFPLILECHFKYNRYEGGKYEPTLGGWKKYLKEVCPHFYEFLQKDIPVRLPYDKYIHAYCVAGSRSGKTHLLKTLAHATMKRTNSAVVFIEPAGEVSHQIAKWKEHVGSDRLVYIDHALKPGMTPTINPFQISGILPSDRSREAQAVKKVVALQLVEALQEVISKDQNAEISGNMEMVLTHCILALLDYEGATFRDLKRLMDDDAHLIAHARSLFHYPTTVEFFERGFLHKGMTVTKDAINRKLYRLFLTGIFEDLTCSTERTIDLEKMLQERKVIVINLAKGATAAEGGAFGRLITALLLGIAFRRSLPGSKRKPIPIMYIMDECQNFVTKSVSDIVSEAAKFQLFITMAQLQIGQNMGNDLRDAMLNTSVQIGGVNKSALHQSIAKMLGVEPEDIANLKRGEFIINMTGVMPFKFRTSTRLLDWNNSMSDSEWTKVEADQLKRYYRPISESVRAPVPEILPPARRSELPAQHSRQEVLAPKRSNKRRHVRAIAVEIKEEEDIWG
jgi:hypothetical protein